jgi:ligand-binding SRPBCC domain-containing protein
MNIYTLTRQQFLPISITEAWAFFSDPGNLAKITPGDMGFEVVTKLSGQPIYKGMLIEYRVRPLLGIKMKWVTKIGDVEPNRKFVDTQLTGPYSLWEHTHTFKEVKGGVDMTDDVRYALPMGILGTMMHSLMVKKRLKDIFDHRFQTLERYFGPKN